MRDQETNGFDSSDSELSDIPDKEEEDLFIRAPDKTESRGKLVYHVQANIELKEHSTPHFSRREQEVFEAQEFEPPGALRQAVQCLATPRVAAKFPRTRQFETKPDFQLLLDNSDPDLIYFNSKFQCGNLLKATRVQPDTYELVLQHDTNSSHHTQWYFFSVRNVRPDQTVHFRILNFLKPTSLYCEGMQPFLYSLKSNHHPPSPEQTLSAFERDLKKLEPPMLVEDMAPGGWTRGGFNIHYGRCRTFQALQRRCATTTGTTDDDDTDKPGLGGVPRKRRKYYSLSFSYTFTHQKDTVFFSHFIPYTQRRLHKKLEKWSVYEKYCRQDTLCRTVADNPCPMLTITQNVKSFLPRQDISTLLLKNYSLRKWTRKCCEEEESRRKAPVECKDLLLFQQDLVGKYMRFHKNKRCLFLTSRVHPGQTNASFIIEGILEVLLRPDQPVARALRKQYVIVVLPMLNPDGVVYGNYRCSLTGSDLNRQWQRPSRVSHPTIFYGKELLKLIHQMGHSVELFCDIHGHSRRQGLFLYGCTPIGPLTGDKMQEQSETIQSFAKILATQSALVTFSNCTFALQKEKEGTGRIVIFKELGVLNSYTLECSFYGGKQEPPTLFTFKKKGSCVSVRSSSSHISDSKEQEPTPTLSGNFYSFNEALLLGAGEDFVRALYSFYLLRHREQHQFTASLRSPLKLDDHLPRKSLFRTQKKRPATQELSLPLPDPQLAANNQKHQLSGVLEQPVESSPSKSLQGDRPEPLSLSPVRCDHLTLRYQSGNLVKEDLLSPKFSERRVKGETLLNILLKNNQRGSSSNQTESVLQRMIDSVTIEQSSQRGEEVKMASTGMAESPDPPKVFAPESGPLSHYWNKINKPRALKGAMQMKTSMLFRGTTASREKVNSSRSYINPDRQHYSQSGRFPSRFFADFGSPHQLKQSELFRGMNQPVKPVTAEETARSKRAVDLLRVRALMSAEDPEPLFQKARPFQRALLPKRLSDVRGKQIRPHRQEMTTINIGCVEDQEKPSTPVPPSHKAKQSKYIRKLAQTTQLRKQRVPCVFNSARGPPSESNPTTLTSIDPHGDVTRLEFAETLDNLRRKASPRKGSQYVLNDLQMRGLFGGMPDPSVREGFVPSRKKKQFKY